MSAPDPVLSDQNGQIGELTRRGEAAASALARRVGLPCDTQVILSSRGNLLVHLAPAPVVARVATLSARSRRDPFAWLAREVAVAGYCASRGGPVVPPLRGTDPGPYWQHGFAISLWEYVPTADRQPEPAQVGASLARLHQAAIGCPADLGDLLPARDMITEGIEWLERAAVLDQATVTALRSVHREVLAGLAGAGGQPIVLHGDAHAGNLLADAARGWLWIDLEETTRGPAEWDLAVLARNCADGAADALRGYADEAGVAVPDAAALAPFDRARLLEGAVWTLCMAQLHPARYADPARGLLEAVLPA